MKRCDACYRNLADVEYHVFTFDETGRKIRMCIRCVFPDALALWQQKYGETHLH